MTLEALEQIEPITFVRPPAVYAGAHQVNVLFPVILDVSSVQRLVRLGGDGALQTGQAVAWPGHDMDDGLHMPLMQVVKYVLGISLKDARIEGERWLPRVPAGRCKAG